MNVYRDSTMSDDWIYSMKRILLSKLIGENYNIENKIIIDNDTLLPFGSISLDNETIVTLLSIIEDIMEFRNKFQDKKIFNNNDLEELKIELNKWLLYSDEKPNFYFNAIINSIGDLVNEDTIKVYQNVLFEIASNPDFLTRIKVKANSILKDYINPGELDG